MIKSSCKRNDFMSIQKIELNTKTDNKRVFPCFNDRSVHKDLNGKLHFETLLRKHKFDNDEETSSEDMYKGKLRVLDIL